MISARIIFSLLVIFLTASATPAFELTLLKEWDFQYPQTYRDPHFSADGSEIYMFNEMKVLRFDSQTGESRGEFSVEGLNISEKGILNLQLSDDGSTIAFRDYSGRLHFIDVLTDTPLGTMPMEEGTSVRRYDLSSDGSFVLVAMS